MSLVIGDLVGLIRADDSGMRRGLASADQRMRGFQRDVEGRLRDLNGRFVRSTQSMAEGLSDGGREGGRFGQVLGRLAGMAGKLGGVALSIGAMGAKLGIAVPLAAGLVATLANIAPAAALGVSAMLALQLATQTVKLGMVGVGDAVSAALDPSKAAEFEEALKELSPSARAFAKEVKKLSPQFKKLQQDVQERMFKGFDKVLKDMGKSTLPVLRKSLLSSADALNKMGKGVGQAAIGLSKDGTLGTALKGATDGLHNLSRMPGQLVTGLGQVAAAAAPAFSRLTKAAGKAFDRFSEQFTRAFESGRLEAAIEQAIDLIAQLGRIAGNVFKIVGSVFGAAQVSGGGFLGVLEEITKSLAKTFASPEVQAGLKSLFETMSTLAKVAAPLLSKAIVIIAGVFEQLAEPAQELIKVLGDGLGKILDALGPVLIEAAKAAGELVKAFLPFIDLATDLIAELLPSLTPLFRDLGKVFQEAAPFMAQLAENIGNQLKPVLEALPGILEELLPPFVQLAKDVLPQLTDILVGLAPELLRCSEALAQLLLDLAPLIAKFLELAAVILSHILPAVGPIIIGAIRLLADVLSAVAAIVNRYIVPAVKGFAALMRGDFSTAIAHARTIISNFKEDAQKTIQTMVGTIGRALGGLARLMGAKAFEGATNFLKGIGKMAMNSLAKAAALPGQIRRAMGSLNGLLFSAGADIIRGLINGIRSQVSALSGMLGGITGMIPDWKGPEEVDKKLLIPAGQSLMGGLMGGIASQIPALRTQLGDITGGIPSMAMSGAGAGGAGVGGQQRLIIEFAGPEEMRRLVRGIVRVDGRGSAEIAFSQSGR